jgi:hypothetical protein
MSVPHVGKNEVWPPTKLVYSSDSQPTGYSPVPGPGVNYTGPREVLLEVVILVF